MRELLLHVGMDKTGTSAIQRFMVDNMLLLAREHGVCYPKTGLWTDGSHHPVAFSVFGQHGYTPAFLHSLFRDMRKEINHCERVVISSECLFKALIHPEFGTLRKELFSHFENVIVVVYVRRQDLWVDSRYRHAILSGKEISLEKLLTPHFCDYKKWIDAWAGVVGKNNMRVRVYERAQFQGGDIFSDFLSVLNVQRLDDYVMPSTLLNASLGNPESEFKRICNHITTNGTIGHKLNQALLQHGETEYSWRTNVLSCDARYKLLDACSELNADIAREYLGRSDGVLFSSEMDESDCRVVSDEDLILVKHYIESRNRILYAMLLRAIRKGQRSSDARVKGAALRLGSICGISGSPVKSKKARELVIHFGAFKTGSSSIQATLFDNRERFDDVTYVQCGEPNSSNVLRKAFLEPERLAERTFLKSHSRLCDVPVLYLKRMQALKRIAAAMECQDRDRLIVSAEVITHFTPTECKRMLDMLTRYAEVDYFVGYIREPVAYTRSVFQQVLKKQFVSFEMYGKRPVNYAIVTQLDKLVGPERVHVFPFERDLFPNGDVVRHFLEHVGIDPTNIAIHRVNEGLSRLAVKLLYVYRKLIAPRDQEVGDQKSWERFIAGMQTVGDEPFVLHPSVEASVAQVNHSVYEWSRNRLDVPLKPPTPQHEEGIRHEADLMTFSEAELELFVQYANDVLQCRVSLPRSSAQTAEIMQQIRTRFMS